MATKGSSLNRTAFSATARCLTGCAIGEVLGMVIGTALGWGNFATIALAVVLAFYFGYLLTMLPLLRSGLALASVLPLAFAADTLSIAVMEIVDNLVMLVVPGAMEAGLGNLLLGEPRLRAGGGFRRGLSGQPILDFSGQRARSGSRISRGARAPRPLRTQREDRVRV